MNKNQLKSFIRKTINEQNSSNNVRVYGEGYEAMNKWIKKNGLNDLPSKLMYDILLLILKNYDNVPLGLQQVIDKYRKSPGPPKFRPGPYKHLIDIK